MKRVVGVRRAAKDYFRRRTQDMRKRVRNRRGRADYWSQRGQLALFFEELPPAPDKSAWADGPWQHEPDYLSFPHVGVRCRLVRAHTGGWCGYVRLPQRHPFRPPRRGRRRELDLEVHGGITFDEQIGGAHWLGFDCGHYNDYLPAIDAKLRAVYPATAPSLFDKFTVYRAIDFALAEVKRLAEQVAEAQ